MSESEGLVAGTGLFRARFGGPEGTVVAAFRNLATAPGVERRIDARLGIFQARHVLPEAEGSGSWGFVSPADGIFAVLTDCEYRTVRRERVVAEGLLEFHFLLAGPVELSLPQEQDATSPPDVSLMVCKQSPGMAYEVVCQPGSYRMVSFYVCPVLLQESFGMDFSRSAAPQLLAPGEGTMAMSEHKIDPGFLRDLRDLLDIGFSAARDLPLAAGRILDLLVQSVDAVDRGSKADERSIVFTARELAMFDRAREALAGDFSEAQTIPQLARRLGTNATKLKSGFRLLYGATIFAYRNRHRMDRAMQLLAEGRSSIATVAHMVGFRHQASFTSAFRAHFGMTPKQARQKLAPTEPF